MASACEALDWTFIGSASSHSAFAGVAGGFVFAVIGILIGQRDGGRKRITALILFTSAFFILALDSLLFGVVAGEQLCMRAHTEGMVASGLLGIGAVSMFIGLAWLFDLFETRDDGAADLERLSRVVVYATEAIAILLLTVTAFGFLNDLITLRSWKGTAPPL